MSIRARAVFHPQFRLLVSTAFFLPAGSSSSSTSAVLTKLRMSTSDGGAAHQPIPSAAEVQAACDVLSVSAGCSNDELKVAFQSLAKTHHPDVAAGGSDVEMGAVTNAYQLLRRTTAEQRIKVLSGGGAGGSSRHFTPEEYEKAMKMFRGARKTPPLKTDGTTAAFNRSTAAKSAASPAAAGKPEFTLNTAPWINSRRANEELGSPIQRLWVLCGYPLIFLVFVWALWWAMHWRWVFEKLFGTKAKTEK